MGAFSALLTMIELKLEPDMAVALIGAIEQEIKGYGEQYVPERVIKLRKLLVEIDQKLEEKFEQAKTEMTAEAHALENND